MNTKPTPQQASHSAALPHIHVLAAQVMIVLLFLGAVITQFVLLPTLAAQQAAQDPTKAYLQLPYTLWCGAIIGGFELGLFAIWKLLSLVKRNTVFTQPSRYWVTLIIYCAGADTILLALLLAHITLIAHVGTVFTNCILAAIVIFGITFVLIMLVMRQLLDSATADRTELEAVI